MNAPVAVLSIGLCCLAVTTGTGAKSNDACQGKQSNREMRECYAAEQARANAEADALANKIASEFRQEAQDASNGAVVNDLVNRAATGVLDSQKSWKRYRDQHCRAVELSWTTGSGAGTAYESCMFNLAEQRIQDLRNDFNVDVQQSKAKK
jgi:uncharacterized protein YecT (DUF1311 family)